MTTPHPDPAHADGADVVTRFAPSPTGDLHIGGARTALFCWALARRAGGRFLLRIEDTDRARSSGAYEHAILNDLAWLGIHWDDGPTHTTPDGRSLGGDGRAVGPFRQSERLDLYNEHIDRLIAAGDAYPAFESTEELDAKRQAARAEKRDYRYDRAALQLAEDERMTRMRAGEEHVVRFRMPNETVTVEDAVLGAVSFAPGEADDFIIRKRDGFPTYHFAVVVDDALMGVTHILRGQEHLNNTPRHAALQKALGFALPVYAHMPLIFNDRGAKMSKRERDQAARDAVEQAGLSAPPPGAAVDADRFAEWLSDKTRQLPPDELASLADALGLHLPEVSVADFRAAGYLPEVLTNYIALLGFSPAKHDDGSEREKFDTAFLASDFGLKRIGKTNARFDRAKLHAFNFDAIQAMPDDAFADRWLAWAREHDPGLAAKLDALGDERFRILARAVRPRAKTLREAAEPAAFAFRDTDAIEYDAKAVKKNLLKGEPRGIDVLPDLRDALDAAHPWTPDAIDAAIQSFAQARELGMGKVAQPLRVALTGSAVSPPLGDTLAVLTKPVTLQRIDRALQEISPDDA